MKNKALYSITCVASILLILPSVFSNSPIVVALSGVGCSGLAAGVLAIFLECSENKREKQRMNKARQIFFHEFYSQLKMIIERLLWFNYRLEEDDFNWGLDPLEYSSFRYMLFAHSISQEKTISFQEAEEILIKIGKKYNIENIKSLSEKQRAKVQKMFLIVAASSRYLLREANNVENNKLLLNIEEYITIEEVKQLNFDIALAIGIMQKTDKNYDVAIKSLLSAIKKIREIGNYSDNIRIGLHGSMEITEL